MEVIAKGLADILFFLLIITEVALLGGDEWGTTCWRTAQRTLDTLLPTLLRYLVSYLDGGNEEVASAFCLALCHLFYYLLYLGIKVTILTIALQWALFSDSGCKNGLPTSKMLNFWIFFPFLVIVVFTDWTKTYLNLQQKKKHQYLKEIMLVFVFLLVSGGPGRWGTK